MRSYESYIVISYCAKPCFPERVILVEFYCLSAGWPWVRRMPSRDLIQDIWNRIHFIHFASTLFTYFSWFFQFIFPPELFFGSGCIRITASWAKLACLVCPTSLWWLPPHLWASPARGVAWAIGTSVSDWWFGTFSIFSQKYLEFHHPNWRTYIFQRGRYTTNQVWRRFSLSVRTSSTAVRISLQPSPTGWIHLPCRPWLAACPFPWRPWEFRPPTADPPLWPRRGASSSKLWTGTSERGMEIYMIYSASRGKNTSQVYASSWRLM